MASPAAPDPSGAPQLAVVLVLDVVGSTTLLDRLGSDRFDRALAALDAVVDATVSAAGGWIVKRTGDGVLAAFLSASAAVATAVRLQQSVARRRALHPDVGIEVRICLAAGDVSFVRGDCIGRAPIVAARMEQLAGAGDVLVTDAVRVLAAGRSGLQFERVGEREVRSLEEPVSVWSVPWTPVSRTVDLLGLPRALEAQRRTPFVGRGAVLRTVAAAWSDAGAGSGRVVLLTGEPGVGKTRLLARIGEQLGASGGLVLHGFSDEFVDAPFQPFAQVVRAVAAATGGNDLSLVHTASELSRVVPELLEVVPGAVSPPAVDPDTGRQRLFAAFRSWLAELATEAPVALLIDDLTWANRSTLDLFAQLAEAAADLPVLLVGVLRDTDPRPDAARLVASVSARPHALVLHLDGLPDAELGELVAVLAGAELREDVAGLVPELARLTGGNPLFVRELVQHWRDRGPEDGARTPLGVLLATRSVPAAIGDLVRRRLLHLSDPALAVVRAGAVCGTSFGVELLSELVALEPDDLGTAVKEACEAGLLAERPDGTFTFLHTLVRRTVYDDLPIGVRRLQHRRAGEAIEAMAADRLDPLLPALAHHFGRATGADVHKAVDYAIRAAGAATHHLDHAYAAQNLEEAAALVTRSGARLGPGPQSDLLRALGMARNQAGLAGGRELLLEAGRIAVAEGDAARCAGAALANTRGMFSPVGRVDGERTVALEQALSLPGHDAGTRAALLATLAAERTLADPSSAEKLSREALALAERSSDPEVVTRSLALRLVALWRPGRLPERVALARRLLRHIDEQPLPVPYRLFSAAVAHQPFIEAGFMEEGVAAFEQSLALADELGSPLVRANLRIRSAIWETTVCRFDEALATIDEVVSLQRQGGAPDAELVGVMLRLYVHYVRGDLEAVLHEAEACALAHPDVPLLTAAVAGAAAEHDDRARCERIYAHLAADGFPFGDDLNLLPSLCFAGHAAQYLGDRPGVQRVVDLLVPHADAYVDNGALHLGPVVQQLARLHGFLGEHELAEREFEQVLQLTDRSIGPWSFVAVRLNWAGYLLDRGDDPSRVQLLLEAARPVANRHGLRRMKRRIAELDARLHA